MKPPFFFRLLATSMGLNCMVAVEIAEADDQQEIQDAVERLAGVEQLQEAAPEARRIHGVRPVKAPMVAGREAMDWAKMMGMTPLMFTFIGM